MVGSRVKLFYFFNFIAKEVNAKSVIIIPWEHIQHIAFDAEVTVPEVGSSASVETLHKPMHQFSAGHCITPFNGNHVLLKFHRVTNTIEARYRGYHQHIAPAR